MVVRTMGLEVSDNGHHAQFDWVIMIQALPNNVTFATDLAKLDMRLSHVHNFFEFGI